MLQVGSNQSRDENNVLRVAMLGLISRGRGVRGRGRGGRGVGRDYMQVHWHIIVFLKKFLAWRLGDETWKSIVTKPMKCPKQENSNDCAIFVLRYIYNIITEQYMLFNQDDVSKERLILAMRILSHLQNLYQRTRRS